MKLFDNKVELGGYWLGGLVLVVILPLLNAFVPEGSLFHFSDLQIGLWGKYITWAILAMSLNLLWGYTGLLCLCQALFFALGAYAFGMYLMLHAGVDPVYNTALPDFMDFQGYTSLPWYWAPFKSGTFAVIASMVIPGVLALVFGYLAFGSRIKGVYFSILTQALTYALSLFFFMNTATVFGKSFILFGGNNGLNNFGEIFGFGINYPSTKRWVFIGSAVLLLVVYVLIAWLVKTKFGMVQQAIRDSENRVRFSGYSTMSYKLLLFVGAAMIAGIAGAFYVPLVGGINANEMVPAKSLDVVVWVALGGRGTKFGPVIGAIVVSVIKSYAQVEFPNSWLIILGAIFMFVVLFMPNGLVGLPKQLAPLFARMRKKDTATPEVVTSSAS